MANPHRAVPGWISKWLMINSAILFFDGSFCVLRPHSLPGGALETVYYGYKYYIMADKHYADQTDSFIWTQGFGNLIEATICVLILLKVFKSLPLSKMMTIIVSVMTYYKTVLFCLYSLDIGQGGKAYEGFLVEFAVFGLGSIWMIVPACVIWTLLQDFVDIKPMKFNSPFKTASTPNSRSKISDGTPRSNRYNLRRRSKD